MAEKYCNAHLFAYMCIICLVFKSKDGFGANVIFLKIMLDFSIDLQIWKFLGCNFLWIFEVQIFGG